MTILTNLVSTSSALFAVAFTRSSMTLKIHVTALEPQTGFVLCTREVPSNVKHSQTYTVLSSSTSETNRPHVAWIENGLLKSFQLTPELNAKPDSVVFQHTVQPLPVYERILDVGLSLSGSAVAVASDGSATLLGLEGDTVVGIGALASLISNPGKDNEDITESIWVGALGEKAGEVLVGRVYWSHKINVRPSCLVCSFQASLMTQAPAENKSRNTDLHFSAWHPSQVKQCCL